MTAHAKWFSASASRKWLTCAASIQREEGIPNASSPDARWGTAAHHYSELCLREHREPSEFLGAFWVADGGEPIKVDEEMVDCVKVYVDFVRHLVSTTGGTLLVEQRVDYRPFLAEGIGDDDGFGTADAVILTDHRCIVVDLKGGAGVPVEAVGNTQLQLYALGAYAEHGMFHDFKEVEMHIVQPRNGGCREWVITVEELLAFGEKVRAATTVICEAMLTGEVLPARVSEAGCRWCRAKATCPDMQADVLQTVFGDFDNLETAEPQTTPVASLPVVWGKLKMIEGWCNAIRERMLEETRSGSLPDYKLVEGRRGNRRWKSAEEAEALMKSMRLKREEMYSFSLIGVPAAEKLLKEKPRSWAKVKALVEQPDGAPTVAHISDPRPALAAPADAFEDLSSSDLF